MNRNPLIFLRYFGCIAVMLALSACTTVQKKFTSTDKANVGIFADNTMAMLKEADFGFTKENNIYTREFFADEPEERLFVEKQDKAELVLNGMMKYSLKLVSIAANHERPKDRINAYTDYLSELDDSIIDALELDKEYFTDMIKEVNEQDKFMDALEKAQPLIDSLGRFMGQTLDELVNAAEVLAVKVDKKIDHRYADLIRYQRALEGGKYAILSSMEQLYLAGKGDTDALKRIQAGKTLIPTEMISKGRPNYAKRQEVIQYLIQYLNTLHRIGEEIKPDWELYRETHLELDSLEKLLKQEARKMRLITLVWIRAHQKMAAGVASPAEWFDINEAPGMLLKMGTRAL